MFLSFFTIIVSWFAIVKQKCICLWIFICIFKAHHICLRGLVWSVEVLWSFIYGDIFEWRLRIVRTQVGLFKIHPVLSLHSKKVNVNNYNLLSQGVELTSWEDYSIREMLWNNTISLNTSQIVLKIKVVLILTTHNNQLFQFICLFSNIIKIL